MLADIRGCAKGSEETPVSIAGHRIRGPHLTGVARRLKKNGIKLADDEAEKQQGSPSHHRNNAVTSDTASEVTLIGTENEKSPSGGSQLIKA